MAVSVWVVPSTVVGAVVDGGTPVVVVISTGEPIRSGTRVWDGPDAGGGTGAVLFFVVVAVVAPRPVVVVLLRAVVVVVTSGGAVVDGGVVVVGAGGGVVVVGSSTCARTPVAVIPEQIASAPNQTQRLRRTAPS